MQNMTSHTNAHRLLAAAVIVAVAIIALADAGPARVAPTSAGSTPGGFLSETLVSGLTVPEDFAFAPDGRIFIALQSGEVRIVKDGALLPDPFIQLPANNFWERGLAGLALDPDFANNGFVYLYYTHENNSADFEAAKTGRLVRVTADGDVALPGSEVVLLGSVVGDATQPSIPRMRWPISTAA